MAQRDRSQGFGFVYVDLTKLLAQRDQLEKSTTTFPPAGAAVVNFNKDTSTLHVKQAPVQNVPDPGRSQAIRQIKENLDRLQTLHHKLHAMLEELNHLTDREKKKQAKSE